MAVHQVPKCMEQTDCNTNSLRRGGVRPDTIEGAEKITSKTLRGLSSDFSRVSLTQCAPDAAASLPLPHLSPAHPPLCSLAHTCPAPCPSSFRLSLNCHLITELPLTHYLPLSGLRLSLKTNHHLTHSMFALFICSWPGSFHVGGKPQEEFLVPCQSSLELKNLYNTNLH